MPFDRNCSLKLKTIWKCCTGLLRTCFYCEIFVFRRPIFNSSWPILRQQIKRHNIWATKLKCLSLPLLKKTSHCYEWEYTLNMEIAGTVLHFDIRFFLSCMKFKSCKIFLSLCDIKLYMGSDYIIYWLEWCSFFLSLDNV